MYVCYVQCMYLSNSSTLTLTLTHDLRIRRPPSPRLISPSCFSKDGQCQELPVSEPYSKTLCNRSLLAIRFYWVSGTRSVRNFIESRSFAQLCAFQSWCAGRFGYVALLLVAFVLFLFFSYLFENVWY